MPVSINSQEAGAFPNGYHQDISAPTQPNNPALYSFTNSGGTVLYLVVALGPDAGGSSSFGAVSYGGVAMTKLIDEPDPGSHGRVGLFRLLNPPTGANNFSIAFTLSGNTAPDSYTVTAGAISFTGNDMVTPEKQTPTANGNSSAPSVTLTTVVAGNYTFAGAGSGTHAATRTQTLTFDSTDDDLSTMGSLEGTVATGNTGTVIHNWNLNGGASDSWAVVAVEVQAGAGQSVIPVSAAHFGYFGPF